MRKKYTKATRTKLVNDVKGGMTVLQAAKKYGTAIGTAYAWVGKARPAGFAEQLEARFKADAIGRAKRAPSKPELEANKRDILQLENNYLKAKIALLEASA